MTTEKIKLPIILLLICGPLLKADQITHSFKSPSFSGVNTSGHYLTIENQESTRVKSIEDDKAEQIDAAIREQSNSTLARFIRNFESRVYAQLSRQLVDNLFGENPNTQGELTLEGNTIEYAVENETITLTITDETGGVTVISIPLNQFTF